MPRILKPKTGLITKNQKVEFQNSWIQNPKGQYIETEGSRFYLIANVLIIAYGRRLGNRLKNRIQNTEIQITESQNTETQKTKIQNPKCEYIETHNTEAIYPN